MHVYVGDSANLRNRIRTSHVGGNVEASAFRKHVATSIGWSTTREKRLGGGWRVRLDLPDAEGGEAWLSSYIRSGSWRIAECASYGEANQLQWFAIQRLEPLLNRDRRVPDAGHEARLNDLLERLLTSPSYAGPTLRELPATPGVYLFEHSAMPSKP